MSVSQTILKQPMDVNNNLYLIPVNSLWKLFKILSWLILHVYIHTSEATCELLIQAMIIERKLKMTKMK